MSADDLPRLGEGLLTALHDRKVRQWKSIEESYAAFLSEVAAAVSATLEGHSPADAGRALPDDHVRPGVGRGDE